MRLNLYVKNACRAIIAIHGTLANTVGAINPYRYRVYRYDTETGMYYLQSRYYSPEIGRFINADVLLSGIGESVLGCNTFSYCINNPVNMYDPTGLMYDYWNTDITERSTCKRKSEFTHKSGYTGKRNFTNTHKGPNEQTLRTPIMGVRSNGWTASVSAGGTIFSYSKGKASDESGNEKDVDIYTTGLASGGVSLCMYYTQTNALNLEEFQGTAIQIGGSYSIIAMVGMDIVLFQDPYSGDWAYGTTIYFGIGTPGPEVHTEIAYTRFRK